MEGDKKRTHVNKSKYEGGPSKKIRGDKSSNNTKMHPNNLYKDSPPNFSALASKYASFSPFVHTNTTGGPSIDWTDPLAVRELTKVLLDNDFQIKFDMPMDRLCPTVTLRSNYIHWLNDLMNLGVHEHAIRGIDIGTGASCIYPLLGHRLHGWSFLATDIDEYSLVHAKTNVETNKWENEIELRFVPDRKKILVDVLKENERFDFCMCNPPFFETLEQTGLSDKTVCTGSSNELVTEGGEYQFVGKMISDSLVLKDQVRWYTSMLGRKASMKGLLAELKKNQIVNVRTTTFYQGRTTRWAIAWSFGKDGFEELLEQRRQEIANKRRAPSSCCFDITTSQQPSYILRLFCGLFDSIGISHTSNAQLYNIKGHLTESTWIGATTFFEEQNDHTTSTSSSNENAEENEFIGPAPPPKKQDTTSTANTPTSTHTNTTTSTTSTIPSIPSHSEVTDEPTTTSEEFIGPAWPPSKRPSSSEPAQSSQRSLSLPPQSLQPTEASINIDQKGDTNDEEILCKFEIMILKVRGNNEYMVDFKLRGGESKDVFVDFFELCKTYVKNEIKNVS